MLDLVNNENFKTLKFSNENDGILKVTLSRVEALNALNQTVLEELEQVLCYTQKSPDVKSLLLTGEGKAFCAGADINRLQEIDAITGKQFAEYGQYVFNLLEKLNKPSLAMINGFAFGGGCELAMSASMRVAGEKAQFGQPEVKLGVIPGYGGTQRLARLIGKGRALDLCLTGRFIDADTAMQYGLVSHVFSQESLLEESLKILQTIMGMGPEAVSSVLTCVNQGFDLPLADALALEALHFGQCCATGNKAEGVSAFLEKRKANFNG